MKTRSENEAKAARVSVLGGFVVFVVAAAVIVSCASKQQARDDAGGAAREGAGEAAREAAREAAPQEETPPPATPSPTTPTGEFSVDGTVLKLPVETGCWVIRTLEGTQYEPMNLSNDFRNEGVRVRARLRARSDRASTCMVGPIVEVVAIEILE